MNIKRIWAIFIARNYEFFRDKAAFGWNFLFPFLIIAGFGIIFGGRDYGGFKAGVFPSPEQEVAVSQLALPPGLKEVRYLEFLGFKNFEDGIDRLKHHKIDILLKLDAANEYWVNESSPKGYVVEQLFLASFIQDKTAYGEKKQVRGRLIPYMDWLFPGILAMNMMFSALWGVGYIIVRYRKNGVLKRLKATPLTAVEYLTAQALSRLFLLIFTVIVLWIGAEIIFPMQVVGSYMDLFIVFLLGGLSLTSMGLVLAARGTSEEFTSGVLNFISWPMMFLSEVWFSIENAPHWVKTLAEMLPLTHLIRAGRKIMNDGAGLADVTLECTVMLGVTLLCLILASTIFSWNE